MRLHELGLRVLATVLLAIAVCAAPVWANVYASGLSKTSPSSLNYILNDNADSVTMRVWEVGGGMVYSEDQGALSKGSHPWTWNGSGYQPGKTYHAAITAHAPGYSGWTQISPNGASTSFYSPAGVSVNRMQTSPNFGKIYVSEAQGGPAGFGRTTTSGIYMLNADASEAGFADGGANWTGAGNYAPWKSTIGPDGHLYVADWSNDLAYEFNDDMSVATALINSSNKTTNQYVESIWVSGTGADRVIYIANGNNSSARKGLIKYDIGESASVAPGDTGTQYIGPGYFGKPAKDVARDSEGNWYMPQFHNMNGVAPPISKFTDGAPPLNTAAWEASKDYTGAYGIDIHEQNQWVAYGDYYTGYVRIFKMTDGSYVDGFDAGDTLRDVAFDAVGNIVTVDANTGYMRIWSPKDENIFTTNSYFQIVPEPSSLLALVACLPVLWFRRKS